MRWDFCKWIRSGTNPQNRSTSVSLIYALLIGLGVIAFIKFASEVHEGETREFDETALRFLRVQGNLADALGPPWFERSVFSITSLGSSVVLILVSSISFGFLLIQRRMRAMTFLILGVAGGWALNLGLKRFYGRARPTIVPHLDYVSDASFPSGHALLSTIVYCTVGVILAGFVSDRLSKVYLISVALLLPLAVGFTRVYLGVHHPTDVVAGWTIGFLWTAACWLATRSMNYAGWLSK